MPELQTVLEKFKFCQQKLDGGSSKFMDSSYLANLGGTILSNCRKGFPFEVFWEDFMGEFDVSFLNSEIMKKYNQPEITREDMKLYYNHTFQNWVRNSILH